MGRYNNTGFGHGTIGSPQGMIEQSKHKEKVEELNALNEMVKPLEALGVKFTKKDVLFVTKDTKGKIVWLEKGNSRAGLQHIIERHEQDYKNVYKISKQEMPNYIKTVVSSGKILKETNVMNNDKSGIERIYEYNSQYYTLLALGTNGFIISMYPISLSIKSKD